MKSHTWNLKVMCFSIFPFPRQLPRHWSDMYLIFSLKIKSMEKVSVQPEKDDVVSVNNANSLTVVHVKLARI